MANPSHQRKIQEAIRAEEHLTNFQSLPEVDNIDTLAKAAKTLQDTTFYRGSGFDSSISDFIKNNNNNSQELYKLTEAIINALAQLDSTTTSQNIHNELSQPGIASNLATAIKTLLSQGLSRTDDNFGDIDHAINTIRDVATNIIGQDKDNPIASFAQTIHDIADSIFNLTSDTPRKKAFEFEHVGLQAISDNIKLANQLSKTDSRMYESTKNIYASLASQGNFSTSVETAINSIQSLNTRFFGTENQLHMLITKNVNEYIENETVQFGDIEAAVTTFRAFIDDVTKISTHTEQMSNDIAGSTELTSSINMLSDLNNISISTRQGILAYYKNIVDNLDLTAQQRRIFDQIINDALSNNDHNLNNITQQIHNLVSERLKVIEQQVDSHQPDVLNRIANGRGLGRKIDYNIRTAGESAARLWQSITTSKYTRQPDYNPFHRLYRFPAARLKNIQHEANRISQMQYEYSAGNTEISRLTAKADEAAAKGDVTTAQQIQKQIQLRLEGLGHLIIQINKASAFIGTEWRDMAADDKKRLADNGREMGNEVTNIVNSANDTSRAFLALKAAHGVQANADEMSSIKDVNSALKELKKEAEDAGKKSDNSSNNLLSFIGSIADGISGIFGFIQRTLTTLGLGDFALGPISLAAKANEYHIEQSRERYRSMGAVALIGGEDLNSEAARAQIRMMAGNQLYVQSGGRIDQFAIQKSYRSIVQIGGHIGASPDQTAEDMDYLSKQTALMQHVYGLDQSVVNNVVQTYYRDMRMSAHEAAQAFYRLTQTAQSAGVPIDQYLKAVTDLANKYMSVGISGERAESVLDNLMSQHIRIDIAQEVASQLANSTSRFAQNDNEVAFAAMINGENPFHGLAKAARTHDARGEVRDAWADDMSQYMDTVFNFRTMPYGNNPDMKFWGMVRTLKQNFGFDQRTASMLASKAEKYGTNSSIFKDLLKKSEKKAENPNADLEAKNQSISDELNKMAGQLSAIDHMEAKSRGMLFEMAGTIGGMIDDLTNHLAPLLLAIQQTMIELSIKAVSVISNLVDTDLFQEAKKKILEALKWLPVVLTTFVALFFGKKILGIVFSLLGGAKNIIGKLITAARTNKAAIWRTLKNIPKNPLTIFGAALLGEFVINTPDSMSKMLDGLMSGDEDGGFMKFIKDSPNFGITPWKEREKFDLNNPDAHSTVSEYEQVLGKIDKILAGDYSEISTKEQQDAFLEQLAQIRESQWDENTPRPEVLKKFDQVQKLIKELQAQQGTNTKQDTKSIAGQGSFSDWWNNRPRLNINDPETASATAFQWQDDMLNYTVDALTSNNGTIVQGASSNGTSDKDTATIANQSGAQSSASAQSSANSPTVQTTGGSYISSKTTTPTRQDDTRTDQTGPKPPKFDPNVHDAADVMRAANPDVAQQYGYNGAGEYIDTPTNNDKAIQNAEATREIVQQAANGEPTNNATPPFTEPTVTETQPTDIPSAEASDTVNETPERQEVRRIAQAPDEIITDDSIEELPVLAQISSERSRQLRQELADLYDQRRNMRDKLRYEERHRNELEQQQSKLQAALANAKTNEDKQTITQQLNDIQEHIHESEDISKSLIDSAQQNFQDINKQKRQFDQSVRDDLNRSGKNTRDTVADESNQSQGQVKTSAGETQDKVDSALGQQEQTHKDTVDQTDTIVKNVHDNEMSTMQAISTGIAKALESMAQAAIPSDNKPDKDKQPGDGADKNVSDKDSDESVEEREKREEEERQKQAADRQTMYNVANGKPGTTGKTSNDIEWEYRGRDANGNPIIVAKNAPEAPNAIKGLSGRQGNGTTGSGGMAAGNNAFTSYNQSQDSMAKAIQDATEQAAKIRGKQPPEDLSGRSMKMTPEGKKAGEQAWQNRMNNQPTYSGTWNYTQQDIYANSRTIWNYAKTAYLAGLDRVNTNMHNTANYYLPGQTARQDIYAQGRQNMQYMQDLYQSVKEFHVPINTKKLGDLKDAKSLSVDRSFNAVAYRSSDASRLQRGDGTKYTDTTANGGYGVSQSDTAITTRLSDAKLREAREQADKEREEVYKLKEANKARAFIEDNKNALFRTGADDNRYAFGDNAAEFQSEEETVEELAEQGNKTLNSKKPGKIKYTLHMGWDLDYSRKADFDSIEQVAQLSASPKVLTGYGSVVMTKKELKRQEDQKLINAKMKEYRKQREERHRTAPEREREKKRREEEQRKVEKERKQMVAWQESQQHITEANQQFISNLAMPTDSANRIATMFDDSKWSSDIDLESPSEKQDTNNSAALSREGMGNKIAGDVNLHQRNEQRLSTMRNKLIETFQERHKMLMEAFSKTVEYEHGNIWRQLQIEQNLLADIIKTVVNGFAIMTSAAEFTGGGGSLGTGGSGSLPNVGNISIAGGKIINGVTMTVYNPDPNDPNGEGTLDASISADFFKHVSADSQGYFLAADNNIYPPGTIIEYERDGQKYLAMVVDTGGAFIGKPHNIDIFRGSNYLPNNPIKKDWGTINNASIRVVGQVKGVQDDPSLAYDWKNKQRDKAWVEQHVTLAPGVILSFATDKPASSDTNPVATDIVTTARKYINDKIYGNVDASISLLQNVLKEHGINIMTRNDDITALADLFDQQYQKIDLKHTKPGDILFVKSTDGKIAYAGIQSDKDKMISAHGGIVTESGINHKNDNIIAYRLAPKNGAQNISYTSSMVSQNIYSHRQPTRDDINIAQQLATIAEIDNRIQKISFTPTDERENFYEARDQQIWQNVYDNLYQTYWEQWFADTVYAQLRKDGIIDNSNTRLSLEDLQQIVNANQEQYDVLNNSYKKVIQLLANQYTGMNPQGGFISFNEAAQAIQLDPYNKTIFANNMFNTETGKTPEDIAQMLSGNISKDDIYRGDMNIRSFSGIEFKHLEQLAEQKIYTPTNPVDSLVYNPNTDSSASHIMQIAITATTPNIHPWTNGWDEFNPETGQWNICGSAATATALTASGVTIDPVQLHKAHPVGGPSDVLPALQAHGLDAKEYLFANPDTATDITRALKNRQAVIFAWPTEAGHAQGGPYGSGMSSGHYTTALGIDDTGHIWMSDPGVDINHPEHYQLSSYTISELLQKYTPDVWILNKPMISDINAPSTQATPSNSTATLQNNANIFSSGRVHTFQENQRIITGAAGIADVNSISGQYYRSKAGIANDWNQLANIANQITYTGQVTPDSPPPKLDQVEQGKADHNKTNADDVNTDKPKNDKPTQDKPKDSADPSKNEHDTVSDADKSDQSTSNEDESDNADTNKADGTDKDPTKQDKSEAEKIAAAKKKALEERIKANHKSGLSSAGIPYKLADIREVQNEHPDWTMEQIQTELDKKPIYGKNDEDLLKYYGIQMPAKTDQNRGYTTYVEKYIANNLRRGLAPNGRTFTHNDIQFLKNKNYTDDQIIAALSAHEKYQLDPNQMKFPADVYLHTDIHGNNYANTVIRSPGGTKVIMGVKDPVAAGIIKPKETPIIYHGDTPKQQEIAERLQIDIDKRLRQEHEASLKRLKALKARMQTKYIKGELDKRESHRHLPSALKGNTQVSNEYRQNVGQDIRYRVNVPAKLDSDDITNLTNMLQEALSDNVFTEDEKQEIYDAIYTITQDEQLTTQFITDVAKSISDEQSTPS